MKYTELSQKLLDAAGGIDNISHVTHCASRLRINYYKKSLIDEEALKSLPNVAGFVNKQGQLQIIVGPEVNDAYNTFIEETGWTPNKENGQTPSSDDDEPVKKNFEYFMNKVGNFTAPIFMPIIPALVVGGLILSLRNLLMNYFGVPVDSGTAIVMMAIFDAGFYFLPIYVGFSLAGQLKMQPIMGAILGGLLLSSRINGIEGLDFLGIPIPQASYGSSIFPVFLGVSFMYWVDKGVRKIVPESLKFILSPLLTMIIVAPVTLIVLGPFGTVLSSQFTSAILWVSDTLGFLAIPLVAAIYPYMVMFGFDKAWTPVGVELIATIGYNPLTLVVGFISNISIGASALAVSTTIDDKAKKGMVRGFGITGLCGITEPAFYGALISKPQSLIGTAIGAMAGGLVAGILGLRTFVHLGAPGLLTFLAFVDETGSLKYVLIAALVAIVTIVASFIATKVIVTKSLKKIENV